MGIEMINQTIVTDLKVHTVIENHLRRIKVLENLIKSKL
jgi:hypothetical protein